MRNRMTGLTLAATLLATSAAFAQSQQSPAQSQAQSPVQSQAAPEAGGPGPGRIASPSTEKVPGPATADRATPAPSGEGGRLTAPGAAPGTVAGGAPADNTERPTVATPEAGANSFTQGQAQTRIREAGFTDVTELRKDDQGVWRGQARKNGATTDVGLDFKGNVIAGATPAAPR